MGGENSITAGGDYWDATDIGNDPVFFEIQSKVCGPCSVLRVSVVVVAL
jgi:hypothetical protein